MNDLEKRDILKAISHLRRDNTVLYNVSKLQLSLMHKAGIKLGRDGIKYYWEYMPVKPQHAACRPLLEKMFKDESE